jgi:hypothetical protein
LPYGPVTRKSDFSPFVSQINEREQHLHIRWTSVSHPQSMLYALAICNSRIQLPKQLFDLSLAGKRHRSTMREKGSETHRTHEKGVGTRRSQTAPICAPVRANRVKNRVCCKLAGVPFGTLRRSELVVMRVYHQSTTDRVLARTQ